METSPTFLAFRDMCISVLAQSGNCAASQSDFHAATNVPELCQAFKRYWDGLRTEVPQQVIACFEAHYPTYRDEIRSAGIAYNESHPAPGAFILIGSGTHDIDSSFANPQRVTVLGPATLTLRGNSRAYISHPDAVVTLRQHTRATIRSGTVHCRDWSVCTAGPDTTVHTYDSSTIYSGSTVPEASASGLPTIIDHGHLRIYR